MDGGKAQAQQPGADETKRKNLSVFRWSLMRLVMAVVGLAFTVFVIIDFLLDSEAFLAQVPPIIEITETVALAFCMFVLPPLALFPKTIGLSARGFLLASFIFGLGVWFYGLLAAYEVWERGAAALKGYGDIAVLLLFGLSLAYLSRSAGRYLSKKADILSSVSL